MEEPETRDILHKNPLHPSEALHDLMDVLYAHEMRLRGAHVGETASVDSILLRLLMWFDTLDHRPPSSEFVGLCDLVARVRTLQEK